MFPCLPVVGNPADGVIQRSNTAHAFPSPVTSAGFEAGATLTQAGGTTTLTFKRKWSTGQAADGVRAMRRSSALTASNCYYPCLSHEHRL
jgi:hypothetical protein